MKTTLTLLAFLPFALAAQTIHPVSVGGSTSGSTPPYYTPASLTIELGDIVRWTNVSGTHSVTGTLDLYPGNPEAFDSGDPDNGNWSFQHTFTIPGVYNYTCTQEGHSATQNGTVTVLNTTGLAEVEESGSTIKIFPVPASNVLTITSSGAALRSVRVVDLDGAVVISAPLNASGTTDLDIATLAAGKYFVLLTDADGLVSTKPFSKL